jgi:hypothetical protein
MHVVASEDSDQTMKINAFGVHTGTQQSPVWCTSKAPKW